MASNFTKVQYPLQNNFIAGVVTSFFVSVVIGLALGGFVLTLLMVVSRRKKASASISITQVVPRRARPSSRSLMLSRTECYRSNSNDRDCDALPLSRTLSLQCQGSQDQSDYYNRKSTFRASTFHPFLADPLPEDLAGDQPTSLLRTDTCSTLNCSLGHQEQQWSEGHQLTCLSSQTPPPAYEAVIEPAKNQLT
ncbi:myc target protein 1 homolog [Callorhinchus milii]|uniref:Uncharacterized protein n=1 Tax=Callorhinchus milii TaxID=7868 RepID=A0A4W3HM85_CALMI|nr:myc target protein 1 homolog [Callorhinchus milii]|eukprot:gi/632975976/ref/XP_007904533.1/ PREDICTED: myc target protein 1 [Callorhinchus milii]